MFFLLNENNIGFSRFGYLATIWTNVLTAVILTSGVPFSFIGLIITAISVSLLYAAGMCLQDFYTKQIEEPETALRLPQASFATKGSMTHAAMLFAGGLTLLVFAPHAAAFFPGVFLTACIIGYGVFQKTRPLNVFFMGASRFMVFITSAVAVSGAADVQIWIVGLLQFSYTIAIVELGRREEASGISPGMMLAGVSLLDGFLLAALVSPEWLLAGIGGALTTLHWQRFVKTS